MNLDNALARCEFLEALTRVAFAKVCKLVIAPWQEDNGYVPLGVCMRDCVYVCHGVCMCGFQGVQ